MEQSTALHAARWWGSETGLESAMGREKPGGWVSQHRVWGDVGPVCCDPDYDHAPVRLPDGVAGRFPELLSIIESARPPSSGKWVDLDRTVRDKPQRREVQMFLDEYWPEVEGIATEAIETAGIRWMWSISRLIEVSSPVLVQALKDLVARDSISFTTSWYNVFLSAAPLVAARMEVPIPQPTICLLCGRTFPPELINPAGARHFGDHFCEVCEVLLWAPVDGPSRTGSAQTADRALQRVAEVLGGPVGSKLQTDIPYRALDRAACAQVAAAAACCAGPVDYRHRHRSDWTGVLFALGILSGPTRRGRGAVCVAADGHSCRSMLERTVDDFLHTQGIAHEVEPLWPAHPVLNASGRKRADWLIGDGVLVEMAGLLSDGRYADRMDDKVQLARTLNLRLLVLTPDSLGSLPFLFAEWIPINAPATED